MPIFADRERAYEAKFAKDQEASFKIVAHRNRLLALWVGLAGESASRYVRHIIELESPGHDDNHLLDRLKSDITAAGATLTADELAGELVRCTAKARSDISGH
jgi:hypothetical protein